MASKHPTQSPQPDAQGPCGGAPNPQRNTGEGAASALALLKGRKRVDELVNSEWPPEGESSNEQP